MNNAITSAAPAGKRCTRCLCCDAVIVFEGEALCAACDDGTHPPLPESRPAPLSDPPEQECAVPAPEPEPESRKVSMRRLTPDEIAAIQAAPVSESTAALSRRLGLSDKAVRYQRLVFQRKGTNAQRSAQQWVETNCKPAVTEDIDWVPKPETSLPITYAEEPSTALLCVDEDELNDWWDALDVEAKADAFMQWSLGNDGHNSHVYIKSSIPVVGTLDTATQAAQQ